MGQYGGKDDVGIRRKRTSNFPCCKSIVQRSTQKQRSWKNCRYTTQPIWKRLRLFFRIIVSVNQLSLYGADATKCVKNMKLFTIRTGQPVVWGQSSSSLMLKRHQDRSAFGLWWPRSQRSFIATVWRTNGKAITTRQIEQILYWCRIPYYSWSRTVFHDEKHCRILTIHRCSGLSWVHSTKRRRSITTKRMDPREHQNWTRIGNCNLLVAR